MDHVVLRVPLTLLLGLFAVSSAARSLFRLLLLPFRFLVEVTEGLPPLRRPASRLGEPLPDLLLAHVRLGRQVAQVVLAQNPLLEEVGPEKRLAVLGLRAQTQFSRFEIEDLPRARFFRNLLKESHPCRRPRKDPPPPPSPQSNM